LILRGNGLAKLSLDPRDWFKKDSNKVSGLVGISRDARGIALSYGVLEAGEHSVKLCEYVAIPASEQLAYVKDWVIRNKLKKADCNYVLDESQYELQLLETPPVEENEILEAVRWRLKDLITMPIEDAVIDALPLPEDAYRGRIKMLYAVAATKQTIEETLQFVTRCGLTNSIIDIPEMALRNMALYLPEMDIGTVALLKMKENNGDMLMYSHDAMYLSRQIEMGYSSLSSEAEAFSLDNSVMLERLGLDLQRSLDYYESQLGKGIASKIYVLPIEDENILLEKDLHSYINTPIAIFDYSEFLPVAENIKLSHIEQTHCLSVIGSVLRRVA
jgi:MSHA biogenesis protein MshI